MIRQTNQGAEDPDLTDGREPGDWRSRYDGEAWVQIGIELLYLALLLGTATGSLAIIGLSISNLHPIESHVEVVFSDLEITKTIRNPSEDRVKIVFFDFETSRTILIWIAVAVSGMIGGITFDLKWLYHAVAKHKWNRDRVLWRLIVPIVSGMVSTFVAFMIVSGIVPFLNNRSFDSLYFGMGFGFLFGYFSDNVIAALHNLAQRIFHTTRDISDNGG
ncbi:MAG: DUF1129 domain-containing protein [Nitrososphaera sp.]|nr:DUF1129 domain-containing protein [Nitrososphaera sp.]